MLSMSFAPEQNVPGNNFISAAGEWNLLAEFHIFVYLLFLIAASLGRSHGKNELFDFCKTAERNRTLFRS
jgi:hypothetical protein